MWQKVTPKPQPDFSGGLNTNPNLLALQTNQTPHCMDVRFPVGGFLEKRYGTQTVNSVVIVSTTSSGFSPDSSGTLAVALTAFWNLDEQSGTRFDAFDGQDLSDAKGPTFAAGKLGNALLYNSTSNDQGYLYRNSAKAFDTTSGSFTLSGWVYPTQYSHIGFQSLANLGYHDNILGKNNRWSLDATGLDNSITFLLHQSSKPFAVDAGAKLGSSLVAYWKLDEDTGTRRDAVGLNDLSAINNPDQWGGGISRSALNLARASSMYLNVGDNADLSTGDIDFTFAGWVRLATKQTAGNTLGYMGIARKGAAPQREWVLYWDNNADRFAFFISADGTNAVTTVSDNALGSPSTAQWYFLTAWHDAANNQIGLQVNALTATTTLTAGSAPIDRTGAFEIGRHAGQTLWDGQVDECGWWKRVLSAGERSDLFNSGSGQTYLSAGSIRRLRSAALATGGWTMVTAQYNSATSTQSLQLNTATATTALNVAFPITPAVAYPSFLLETSFLPTYGERFLVDAGGTLLNQLAAYFHPNNVTVTQSASATRYWDLDVLDEVTQDYSLYADTRGSLPTAVPNHTTGVLAVNSSLQFNASSSQYLSSGFASSGTGDELNLRDEDFTLATWVYLSDTASNAAFVSKYSSATIAEYVAWYTAGLNRLVFTVYGSGGLVVGQAVGNTAGAVALNTWYLLTGVHSATNNFVGIRVNTFAMADTALTSGSTPAPTQANLELGRRGDASMYLSGRLMDVGLWKRVLSVAEVNDLWNSGSSNAYRRVENDWSYPGRLDQWGFWGKALTAAEVADLYNGTSGNSYSARNSFAGWGSFDFGAGLGADGKPLRWLTVAAATGIYASSNRGVSFVQITTGRGADYQEFERSKVYLIACSNSGDAVLYWAGSAGTNMSRLAPGSAPAAKHPLDYQGFLLLMNDSGGKRRVSYADNTKILTDPWTNTFELPSSYDDEITGAAILNKKAYVSTKYKLFRVSHVGGNPDFAYQELKEWGFLPRTIKKVTFPDIGEVMIGLCWDKKVRIFDGSEDRVISDTIEFSNGVAPVYLRNLREEELLRCHAEVNTTEGEYVLQVCLSPSSKATHAAVLNLRTGAWYPFSHQHFGTMVMAESGNTRVLVGIGTDGFCHYLNTGNTDAGTPVSEVYESPYTFGTVPSQVVKSAKADFYFSAMSSGTLYLEDHVDFGRTFRLKDQVTLTAGAGSTLIHKAVNIPSEQNVYQWRISSSGSTAQPYRLVRVDGLGTPLGYGEA